MIFTSQQFTSLLKKVNETSFHNELPSDINGGDCYNWAMVIKSLRPEVKLFFLRGHAFIHFIGKFYDAEIIKGVQHWSSLPSMKGVPKYLEIEEQSIEVFCEAPRPKGRGF